MSVGVKMTGDWKRAQQILNATPAEIAAAIPKAIAMEANYMVAAVVKYIGKGVPPPLAASTIKRRKVGGFGGSKALMRTGDLRNSVCVVQEGDEAFVGVLRTSGKANLAEVHEFGATIVIRTTPKMLRFLYGVLFKDTAHTGKGTGGTGIIVVRIPPRPFIRPVFDAEAGGAVDRMIKWLSKHLPNLGKA